jgi:hypothetical protein
MARLTFQASKARCSQNVGHPHADMLPDWQHREFSRVGINLRDPPAVYTPPTKEMLDEFINLDFFMTLKRGNKDP